MKFDGAEEFGSPFAVRQFSLASTQTTTLPQNDEACEPYRLDQRHQV